MAKIYPFRAIRYSQAKIKDLSNVVCPPYDVISSEEARVIAKGNQYSFLHVVKSEIDFPTNTDLHSDTVYKKGAENLQELMKKGVLVRSKTPSLYIYRQKMGDIVQTLPALSALRKSFPDARISWFVRKEFAPLIKGHPYLDEIILFDRKFLGKSIYNPKAFSTLVSLIKKLRKGKK